MPTIDYDGNLIVKPLWWRQIRKRVDRVVLFYSFDSPLIDVSFIGDEGLILRLTNVDSIDFNLWLSRRKNPVERFVNFGGISL